MGFDLSKYETVEDRLGRFWIDHPQGRIATSIYFYDENKVVIRAEAYFDTAADMYPAGVGHAEEIRGASPVNKTSHVENCETSAIGRALANCNYAPKGARPSREEMEKVVQGSAPERTVQAPTTQPIVPRASSAIVDKSLASSPQIGKLSALLMGLGIDRDKRLEFISNALDRPVTSMSEITKVEASKLIGELV